MRSLRCWERDIMKLPRFIGASGCNDICVTCLAKVCRKKKMKIKQKRKIPKVFSESQPLSLLYGPDVHKQLSLQKSLWPQLGLHEQTCCKGVALRGVWTKVTQVHPDATESTSTFTSSQINAAYKGPVTFSKIYGNHFCEYQ